MELEGLSTLTLRLWVTSGQLASLEQTIQRINQIALACRKTTERNPPGFIQIEIEQAVFNTTLHVLFHAVKLVVPQTLPIDTAEAHSRSVVEHEELRTPLVFLTKIFDSLQLFPAKSSDPKIRRECTVCGEEKSFTFSPGYELPDCGPHGHPFVKIDEPEKKEDTE